MPLPDKLRRVARYIELMDGAELPPDIAAETYAPTQVEKAAFRGNKPEEREDDTLRRNEPPAIDAVLNGHGPQALNLDIGSSADGSMTGIEGVAVSIYDDTARALRAEQIRDGKDPGLYEIGREVLGLDDKQARALFQGPNTAGSARRWIGTQAAADACRALADETAPEKLWDGKFDRLAVATAAAREAGARQDGLHGESELGGPRNRAGSNGAPDRLDRRRRTDRQRRLHRRERPARIRRPRRPGSDDRTGNSGPERIHRRRTLAHPAELRYRRTRRGRGPDRSRRPHGPETGNGTRREPIRNANHRMRRRGGRKGRDHGQARNSGTTRVDGHRTQRRVAAGTRHGDIRARDTRRNKPCHMGGSGDPERGHRACREERKLHQARSCTRERRSGPERKSGEAAKSGAERASNRADQSEEPRGSTREQG